ncbi:membrane progestin receptor gamma-B-like [Rhopilema esculentum]|uniref:membrane progestin receptor gamma-B-like n=1 Tax=Rhopilema esculentum TaxID=499914 RepID=UPI0031D5A32C
MFNSMSPSAQHCCFFMDYAAIGVYSVGVGQAFFFYARPIAPEIFPFKSAQPFTIISQLTSITTTLLCCLSRLYWTKHKYLIRTSSFVAPFLVNASPYLYRMIYCANDVDCISQDSSWVFQIHCFFYIASALINILRVPERVYPGKFDLLGHSHHFLHIFTAIGASYQFDSINLDMRARKSELMKQAVQCNFWNTILSFLISVIMNFGIALIFGSKAGEHTEENEKEKTT